MKVWQSIMLFIGSLVGLMCLYPHSYMAFQKIPVPEADSFVGTMQGIRETIIPILERIPYVKYILIIILGVSAYEIYRKQIK